MRTLTTALVLALAGCGSLDATYVDADRKTLDAIAPVYLRYVEADDDLTERERERKRSLIRSWEHRLQDAEHHLEDSSG